MALSGDPDRMESLKVDVSGLDLRIGRSDVRGGATLVNPKRPELRMTASSKVLDLDELWGDDEDEEDGPSEPRQDKPGWRDYRFEGAFTAAKVIYEGAELQDFRGKVRLEDGRLVLDEATFGAYGGQVSASGTTAEIWRGKMPFHAKVRANNLELGRALSEQTRYKDVLEGRADLTLDLSGVGYRLPDLEKALTGTIDLGLRQGRFKRASLTSAVGGKLTDLERIPGVSTQALAGKNELKDLLAKLVVRDGRLKLVDPVTFGIDGGRATLGGAVGIAGKLFLDGTYYLPGALLAKATGGRCGADHKELPIPIAIAGSVDGPEYRPDVAGVAKGVIDACLKGALAGAAADALKNRVKAATGLDVPTSTAEAQRRAAEEAARLRQQTEARAREEAERQRAEAEGKAKAEADRVRAEADRRAAEEKKKAEEAAKKKAADQLKKLGF
jgi:uncharacterized protein involved in outer membrane biogenesis